MVSLPVSRAPASIAVVVPTYWTRAGGVPLPGDAVYDHPTPVDEVGTLGRLLESLSKLDTSNFYVVVLVAVTCPEVDGEARRVVESIARLVPTVKCLVISQADLPVLASRQDELEDGAIQPNDLVGFSGYPCVRNVQLAIPLVLGCEAIVALDDDEVVTDPQFLERAVDGLGTMVDGRRVDGLGGYYNDQAGKILLDLPAGADREVNIFDRKGVIMNQGTEALESLPARIVPTPFCFGGNMVFSPELAASVCFDPSITRGEDIDYLIGARLNGKWFYLNKDLRILHLPPSGGSYQDVAYHKVVQDVLRFVYEREKLLCWKEVGAAQEVTAEDLDPYPGQFLRTNLESDTRAVVQQIFDATTESQRQTLGLDVSVDAFMAIAHGRARKGVEKYKGYQDAWNRLTARLMTDAATREYLFSRFSSSNVTP